MNDSTIVQRYVIYRDDRDVDYYLIYSELEGNVIRYWTPFIRECIVFDTKEDADWYMGELKRTNALGNVKIQKYVEELVLMPKGVY